MKCQRCGRACTAADTYREVTVCGECLYLILAEWLIHHREVGELTRA